MVKFGFTISQEGIGFDVMKDLATFAEGLGFHSIWLNDHLYPSPQPYLECWTLLSALSRVTTNLRLGTLVLCNSFRHPALLAKMVSTLDVISNGRLELGIGAGWHAKECEAYGIPFSKPIVRIGSLRESIAIMKKMWAEESVTMKEKYYSIKDAICFPKPIQKPSPPIWIGGSGDSLLRVTAQHANGCNFYSEIDPSDFKRKSRKLDQLCLQINRNPREIKRSAAISLAIAKDEATAKEIAQKRVSWGLAHFFFSKYYISRAFKDPRRVSRFLGQRFAGAQYGRIIGTTDKCVDALTKYIEAGADYLMVRFIDPADREQLEIFMDKIAPSLPTR